MEYYGNKLCISARDLEVGGIISQSYCRQLAVRGKVDIIRPGGGKGNYALVAVESLPTNYREKVEKAYPGGDEVLVEGWILSNYELDQGAVAYFNEWATRQRSDRASADLAMKYAVNASVLNTCIKLYENAKASKKLFGEKYDWEKMARVIEVLREKLGHDLPASPLRFRKKANEYKKGGYGVLISKKFGNQNTRKVDHKTRQLILSLAAQPNKPYNTNVHEMYLSFVCGELDVWDFETGELFDPEDFTDKYGDPKELSESTVSNVLNNPANKLRLNRALLSRTAFMHEQMPHMHRHNGEFSLSQVTMDDVDLPRRMKGGEYVHAYYAYDMVSQCRIGLAYGRKKDDRLVVECFRDMFRTIERNGWGMPAGVEVEQHLMSRYKDGFLMAGVAFPFVRFCAPQNSQDKYAEPLNGAFKTTIAHKNHEGIGRWHNKGKRRVEQVKVSDETNHTWEDKRYYTFEELVADDRRDSAEWNNAPHPNQKKYPGMSRWEVLAANINPTLRPLDKLTLSRYIGERVETSVRRNSTVRVAHEDWWLSGPEVLERLQPNNYKVTAYYLPDEEGKATDVYLFQGDRYIDQVERMETYNRVLAERTEEDVAKFVEQRKKVSAFERYLEENAIRKVGVARPDPPEEEEEKAAAVDPLPEPEEDIWREVRTEEYRTGAGNARRALGDI